MQAFQIGLLSFAFPLVMCIAYMFGRARKSATWVSNTKNPKHGTKTNLAVISIAGFILGSGLQPLLNKAVQCSSDGLPMVACIMPFTR